LDGTKLNGREIFADYVILRVLIILLRETMIKKALKTTKEITEITGITEEIVKEIEADLDLTKGEVNYIKFGFISFCRKQEHRTHWPRNSDLRGKPTIHSDLAIVERQL